MATISDRSSRLTNSGFYQSTSWTLPRKTDVLQDFTYNLSCVQQPMETATSTTGRYNVILEHIVTLDS